MNIAQVNFRTGNSDRRWFKNRGFLKEAASGFPFKTALHRNRFTGKLGHHKADGILGTIDHLQIAAINTGRINDRIIQ